jgi:hypothetical protein
VIRRLLQGIFQDGSKRGLEMEFYGNRSTIGLEFYENRSIIGLDFCVLEATIGFGILSNPTLRDSMP